MEATGRFLPLKIARSAAGETMARSPDLRDGCQEIDFLRRGVLRLLGTDVPRRAEGEENVYCFWGVAEQMVAEARVVSARAART